MSCSSARKRSAAAARKLLGTVMHEATRGVARTRQIADTSRQGRARNGRLRAIAEELGLEFIAARGSG